MKTVIILGLVTFSSLVFAGAGGKVFPTSEAAETTCRAEAARYGRDYRISAYYESFGGKLVGWQCHLGQRN